MWKIQWVANNQPIFLGIAILLLVIVLITRLFAKTKKDKRRWNLYLIGISLGTVVYAVFPF
ncbi:hypothetical protein H9S87_18630 (plasmid) [Bacillus pumilus]|uniref:hypothetical protein n=1 Tax=Bacillus pumilus TaxID=1408 RepID=UPI0016576790|nr:hypothetical protein [Bacillus pumilus]QNP18301.1 hypothetical protein H9S87_18630 [Bacillus pumilus]